jgi:uncharacterized phage-associated protein
MVRRKESAMTPEPQAILKSQSRTVTVDDVADFILCRFREKGESVDHLKLQKLVYYVQAWHLALFGEPLFTGEIQAWIHGPVQPQLYSRFKEWRWRPIVLEDLKCPDLPKEVCDHIDEVLSVYAGFSGDELESIVHQEEPWLKARRGLPALEPSHNIIGENEMEVFYLRMAQG